MFEKKSSQIIVGIVALFGILIVGFASYSSLALATRTGIELGDMVEARYGDVNVVEFVINDKQIDVSNCRSIPPEYAINILPLGAKNSGVQLVADKHTLSAPYYLMYESDKPYDFYASEIPSSSITLSNDSATIAFQHPDTTENKVIRVIIADSTGCFEQHFDHIQ